MRRNRFMGLAMRGRLVFCLVALAGLITPVSRVIAQVINVGISAAPVLFAKGQASEVLLCFSSQEQVMQVLEDGDTFTFLFPASIGTITAVGAIDVAAITL